MPSRAFQSERIRDKPNPKPRQGRPIIAQDEVLGTARKKTQAPQGANHLPAKTPSNTARKQSETSKPTLPGAPFKLCLGGMFSYHREFLHWQLNVPPCLGTQTLSRELVERPEDWLCSSFRHHFTGAYGVVEIESGWGTQRRERLGIIPTVRIRSDIQNPAQATLERGTLGSRFEA